MKESEARARQFAVRYLDDFGGIFGSRFGFLPAGMDADPLDVIVYDTLVASQRDGGPGFNLSVPELLYILRRSPSTEEVKQHEERLGSFRKEIQAGIHMIVQGGQTRLKELGPVPRGVLRDYAREVRISKKLSRQLLHKILKKRLGRIGLVQQVDYRGRRAEIHYKPIPIEKSGKFRSALRRHRVERESQALRALPIPRFVFIREDTGPPPYRDALPDPRGRGPPLYAEVNKPTGFRLRALAMERLKADIRRSNRQRAARKLR